MRSRAGILGIATVAGALALACMAPAANAAFGVSKWEAGTCKVSGCAYTSPESAFFTRSPVDPRSASPTSPSTRTVSAFPKEPSRTCGSTFRRASASTPQATGQCTEAQDSKGAGAAACIAKGRAGG